MWLETLHDKQAHEAGCPTCGGGVRRRVYGEMYAGSFVHDGQRVEIRRVPGEGFADPIYLDPITQYFDGGLYKMWPSERYLSRGGKKLHRDVWQAAFGPVPAGCHVHHKDGDILNNKLDNLECLPAKEHLSLPNKYAKFSDKAREKAGEWHKSEEGRLWHSRHAKRTQSWTKWKRIEKTCVQCGQLFVGIERKSGNNQKYCGSACRVAFYRARVEAARKAGCVVPDGS